MSSTTRAVERCKKHDARERTRQIKRHDAILFDSTGQPDFPDHMTLVGLRRAMRQQFDQYACVQPTHILPDIASRQLARSRSPSVCAGSFTIAHVRTSSGHSLKAYATPSGPLVSKAPSTTNCSVARSSIFYRRVGAQLGDRP